MKIEPKKDASKSFLKATNVKSLIKETLYNSTAQSIIKIIETPSIPLKVFLLLCVIVSSGLCSYLIIRVADCNPYLTNRASVSTEKLNNPVK